MIPRRIGFELGAALSIVSVCLTSSVPALAQNDMPPGPEDAPVDETAAPGSDSTATFPEESQPDPGDTEPAREPAPPPAEAPPAPAPVAPVPPAPPEPPPTTTATNTSSERELAVSLVGVEQLPGSAYPETYTRGIKYGSLWLTFHGQQWPYMPALNDKPGTRIGLSGSFWNDLSNARINADESLSGAMGVKDQNRWTTQTRGVFRVTPVYNHGEGWFAQGSAEVVVQGDMRPDTALGGTVNTDDAWVRIGKWGLFDVQFGRFQGWEIANHYGMALDQNTLERQGAVIPTLARKPTDGYGLTYFWDRQNFLLGGYAAHVYPTDYLRGELLAHVGAGPSNNAGNPYQMDIRPSAVFDIGWVKLKAGYEYGKAQPQDKTQKVEDSKNGWGVAAQFVFNPWVEFGGSFARGYQDILDQNGNPDLTGSNTVQTFGGFVNVSPNYEPLVFGFGAFWNHYENFRIDQNLGEHFGEVDTNEQTQIFGAVQYTVWERVFFKFVVAHAENTVEDFNAGIYTNKALSGRFRVMLLY